MLDANEEYHFRMSRFREIDSPEIFLSKVFQEIEEEEFSLCLKKIKSLTFLSSKIFTFLKTAKVSKYKGKHENFIIDSVKTYWRIRAVAKWVNPSAF
jgi:uncharacterized radical SAM superfamily Fe-S cluster-containing enzyme